MGTFFLIPRLLGVDPVPGRCVGWCQAGARGCPSRCCWTQVTRLLLGGGPPSETGATVPTCCVPAAPASLRRGRTIARRSRRRGPRWTAVRGGVPAGSWVVARADGSWCPSWPAEPAGSWRPTAARLAPRSALGGGFPSAGPSLPQTMPTRVLMRFCSFVATGRCRRCTSDFKMARPSSG